jgi:putative ABC transport system ATP-binding protein
MSANKTDNKAFMLAFEDIWVHSKRATPLPTYRRWRARIQKSSASDDALSINNRALISGASGILLAGQVTVLTGASGSGKSVLLRVLAGLLPMTTGDVWLQSDAQNRDTRDSIHEIAPMHWRSQVALLAQQPQLLEGSVIDNLQLPYRLASHQQKHFNIDWHIEQLEYLERTSDFLQQDANTLSGGERQLVNTLRLLQLNPQVLLLDEPTAALDVDTSAKLVHLLINWLRREPTRTLLWVTHDTQDIMPLADKHWHMDAGVLTKVD